MLETNESLDFFISEMKKKAKVDKKKQPKTYGKKVIDCRKVNVDGKQYTEKTFKKNYFDTYTRYYGEPRMILTRKIARNMAKKSQGNNRIRRKWRKFQIERYGISYWCRMYNRCNCNTKNYYVTPENALNI